MKQVGARHDIIREWRSLPKELRQTDEQAEAFAMQIKDKYKFSSDSADPYQTVRGWLLSYLLLMRGLGANVKGSALQSRQGAEIRLRKALPLQGSSLPFPELKFSVPTGHVEQKNWPSE
jgi:hypothetical protein